VGRKKTPGVLWARRAQLNQKENKDRRVVGGFPGHKRIAMQCAENVLTSSRRGR
jgi:hypothetical protein